MWIIYVGSNVGFELGTSLMKKRTKRAGRACAVALAGVVLAGCGGDRVAQAPAENAQSSRSSPNIPDNGVFYRVQAKYELQETGEPINFDFVVSCYNRDVPGSFHGIQFPEVMFHATSTGAAITIAPEEHYCERAVKNIPLVRNTDAIKMPILAWYPDVNNLSFAEVYLTNDAYAGARAKVKFLDFAIEIADRRAFENWYEETRSQYRQFGAIPGPFGCLTENVDSRNNPDACFHPEKLKLNGGKHQVIADDGLSIAHTLVRPLYSNDTDSVISYLETGSQYLCPIYWNYENGAKIRHRFLAEIDSGIAPQSAVNFQLENHRGFLNAKSQNLFRYLDPSCFDPETKCGDISEVYPLLKLQQGNRFIQQSILEDDYLGFGILDRDKKLTLPKVEIQNQNGGVFFANKFLACQSASPQSYQVYDLEKQRLILTDPF